MTVATGDGVVLLAPGSLSTNCVNSFRTEWASFRNPSLSLHARTRIGLYNNIAIHVGGV